MALDVNHLTITQTNTMTISELNLMLIDASGGSGLSIAQMTQPFLRRYNYAQQDPRRECAAGFYVVRRHYSRRCDDL